MNRRGNRIRTFQWAICLVLALLVVGCDLPGKPEPLDQVKPSDAARRFDRLYARHCAGCHGAGGAYGPAPPLNDPLFVAIVSEDALRQVIQNGRPGTPMPAFANERGGSLTPQQVDLIVRGIKQNWKGDGDVPDAPAYELTSHTDGRTSAGDPQRGKQVFARACAGCHGANGRGEHLPINIPAFLALISDQAIRRIIITGRDDLGMPNFASPHGRNDDFQPLTSAEIDDLAALIADWRKSDDLASASDASHSNPPSP